MDLGEIEKLQIFLSSDSPSFNEINREFIIKNREFPDFVDLFLNEIILTSRIRPFSIELCASLIFLLINMDKNDDYIKKMIFLKLISSSPKLLYSVNLIFGVDYQFNANKTKLSPCLNLFFQINQDGFIIPHLENDKIKYGWEKDSFVYALKYDDVDMLLKIESSSAEDQKNIEWSQYEWCIQPSSLSPLCIAAHFGSIKCLKHIIVQKDDHDYYYQALSSGLIDFVPHSFNDIQYRIALRQALLFRRLDIVKWLIEMNKIEGFELKMASKQNYVPLIMNLPNLSSFSSKKGLHPIHYAVINNNIHLLEHFLKEYGLTIVNLKDNIGMTPLHYAAKNGCKRIAQLLISNGAKINILNIDFFIYAISIHHYFLLQQMDMNNFLFILLTLGHI